MTGCNLGKQRGAAAVDGIKRDDAEDQFLDLATDFQPVIANNGSDQ